MTRVWREERAFNAWESFCIPASVAAFHLEFYKECEVQESQYLQKLRLRCFKEVFSLILWHIEANLVFIRKQILFEEMRGSETFLIEEVKM